MPRPEGAASTLALTSRRLAQSLPFRDIWIPVTLAVASVLVYLHTVPLFSLPFDDSFISLQFARNLARHGFLTFDGETSSTGATSLLHVGLLSLPIKFGAEPVAASVVTGVVLQLGLVLAVYWLAKTIFNDRLVSAVSAASVGVIGYLVLDALNGMETTLFLLVTTAAAATFLGARSERRYLAAGMLAALAILARPEGVLLVGAMGAYFLLNPERGHPVLSTSTGRRLALLWGPAIITLVGLAVFNQRTTGSLTPGSATAKYLFFREFEEPLQIRADWVQNGIANFIAPVLPWLALSVFALRRREILLFGFFGVPFVLIYFILFPSGISQYWYRYQHPFLPAIAVFGSAGLVMLVRSRSWRPSDVLSAGVIGVLLAGAVVFQFNGFRNHYADDVADLKARQIEIAQYLRQVLPPGGTVATHDIGAIGFYSERRVIDLVGLVNPKVVKYHEGRHLRDYVDQVKPSYIVVFPTWEESFLKLGLKDDPQLFEEVGSFAREGEPLVVYKTHY
jgi:hypothetical protein